MLLLFSGLEHPTPKSTLTGHNSEVTCVSVLAELGMVVSGSKGIAYLNPLNLILLNVCLF